MKNNDVISLKLTTGEEVVGRLCGEFANVSTYIIILKPLSFVMAQQGLGLGPFMISANKDEKISISMSNVIAVVKTEDTIAKQYLKQSTGLML